MKRYTKRIVLCSAVVVGILVAGSAISLSRTTTDCNNLVGTWKNELNSTLTIESVDATTGAITGKYTSPSGTGGQDFPLVGWVNEAAASTTHPHNVKVISFAVRWGSYGSITSWTGYCLTENSVPTLYMQWHLVRANSDFKWDHIITNHDRFQPTP